MFRMALAVSLRRALLMLLVAAIFVLMVLYWNQSITKNPSFVSEPFEKPIKDRTHHYFPSDSIERMWTYKCEGDKCVRHHFLALQKGEKRVPFMTCSMTCGDINVLPLPTIRSGISTKSVRFSANDVHLHMDTPFSAVESHFQNVFTLFLKDLQRLQKLENSIAKPEERGEDGKSSMYNNRRLHSDIGKMSGSNFAAAAFVSNAFGMRTYCDVDSFEVHVSIPKYSDLTLTFETDESYQLTITHEKRVLRVHINGSSFFGARHGLSTLQQLIWFDDEDKLLRILSKSLIVDAPKFRYRGLMLDTSRHYFSVDAIKRTIVGMSHAKLNRFHWHITDSQSFPYISKSYPELAAHGAYSDHETYTQEDIQEVTRFANLHGVQVIPEIDAPAHAGNGWDWGPQRGLGELSLCINQQPWNFYCGEPPCGQLNPKNNNTYIILQRLYEELLNLTGPTDYFHLGGDEVNLECWGQYFNDTDLRGLWCDFMLNALARLKIANKNLDPKIVAVWSSGLTNTKCLPKHQVAVQIWGGSTWQENHDLIDNGFNVIFSHVDAWYLDCGFGNWRSTGEGACSPYRTWQNVYKHRPWERMRLDKTRRKQVLGGEVCLWTEQVDEAQLDNRLWPRSAALGERLWSDPEDEHDIDVVPQDVFKRMSIFRNRMVELGLKAEPIFPKYCAQNPGECI